MLWACQKEGIQNLIFGASNVMATTNHGMQWRSLVDLFFFSKPSIRCLRNKPSENLGNISETALMTVSFPIKNPSEPPCKTDNTLHHQDRHERPGGEAEYDRLPGNLPARSLAHRPRRPPRRSAVFRPLERALGGAGHRPVDPAATPARLRSLLEAKLLKGKAVLRSLAQDQDHQNFRSASKWHVELSGKLQI